MSELPIGWMQVQLGEICSKPQYGYTTRASATGSTKFLRTTDITRGLNWTSVPFCEEAPADEAKYQLHEGDIVISRAGSVGFSALLKDVPERAVFASYLIRFQPIKGIDQRFLKRFLESHEYWSQITEQSAGNALQNVNADKLSKLRVSLAPAAEQKRIAQKLDALLAQVDTLKARIDAIPALLKRFQLAVLSAATSGSLTESWRASKSSGAGSGFESAESFLERILEERRLHPRIKFKPPLDPDMETRDIAVPEGWVVASVSQFAECLDSMRVPVKKELRANGKGLYPYFGANGEVDRVDEFIFDDDLVLVTEDETFYGRVKPIAYQYSGKCWVNNHVHALRAHDKIGQSFLCYTLMYYDVIPWLTGTTGRAKLTQGALMTLPIGVPSAEEQTEIVRRVEQLFAFADQLEAKVATAKQRIDTLTQSLLAKAFRGELVPQDPNDEPASVLLERIRAQRAAVPKPRRGRKPVSST